MFALRALRSAVHLEGTTRKTPAVKEPTAGVSRESGRSRQAEPALEAQLPEKVQLTERPPARPAPELGISVPKWMLLGTGLVLTDVWAMAVWFSSHWEFPPSVRTAALFVHLIALVVGFGSVLVVDWVGLMWLAGRRAFADVIRIADDLQPPIWVGLTGLLFSGVFLNAQLFVRMTWFKLLLVLLIMLNGLYAWVLHRRLTALGERAVPRPLLMRTTLVVAVLQFAWWGATIIGFLSREARY